MKNPSFKQPELRFLEFNEEWVKKKLGDYYKNLRTGMTPSRSKPHYYDGEILWIASGELNYGFISDTKEKITLDAVKDTNLEVYDPNTLFIAITGLEAPGTRGKCAINLLPATTNQSCMAFDKQVDIETVFLFYWYQRHGISLYYQFAQGTKQQSFNNAIVKEFDFIHPTNSEQKKIASFLTLVDEKINKLKEKKELLEQYKKGVMQKIFSQEIRFKDSNGDDFPDWEDCSLGEVADRITTKNRENNLNVLTISAQQGLINQEKYFNKSVSAKDVTGYYLLNKGDFAYNKSYSNGYPLGAIKLLKNYEKGVVSTLYICFKFNHLVFNEFAEHYFESGSHNREIELIAQEGARNHGLLNVGVKDFFETRMQVPCIAEQKKITAFLQMIDQKLNSVTTQLELMQTWKKGLLQQMFV